ARAPGLRAGVGASFCLSQTEPKLEDCSMTHSLFQLLGRATAQRMLIWTASVFVASLVLLSVMGVLDPLFHSDDEDEFAGEILGRHRYPVHCIAFAPNGKTLASGGGFPGKDGEVRLWDVSSGMVRAILPGHQKCVYAATFSPD